MKRFSLLATFLICIICLFYSAKNRWKGEDGKSWKTVICGDGYGYYSYLPSIFLLHHFDYSKILTEEKKMNPLLLDQLGDLSLSYHGKKYNKYFVGVAVLLSPFFFLAYLFSRLFGFDTDGYSILFQVSVSIGALFYLLIGLLYIRKLLKEYAISEGIIAFVLILIVFATNVFYYVTIGPSLAHIYSFGLGAVFLFYAKKIITESTLKHLLLATISMSLMLLVRPVNVLYIAFIPFLSGNFTATVSFFKAFLNLKYLILCLLVAFIIISIQPLLWYLQTGHFFLWSYQGESFDFSKPHFFDILFSYTNGWLVYTPLMALSLVSLIPLFRENKYMVAGFLLFFVLVTYVLSSWWCWWFGGYGIRAYIDFYPAFILPIGLLLDRLKPLWIKYAVMAIGVLCMLLNLLQTYQCTIGILPYGDMNKEKYWAIFLKTSNRYRGMLSNPLAKDLSFFDDPSFSNNFEHNTWGNDNAISDAYAHSGKLSAMVNGKIIYSPTLSIKCGTLPQQPHLYIYVDFWTLMPSFDNDARVVISINSSDGKSYYYNASFLKSYMDNTNTWQEVDFIYELPAFKNTEENLSVYFYDSKGTAYFDDLQVKFGVLKNVQ